MVWRYLLKPSVKDQYLSCGARLFTRYVPKATTTNMRIVIDRAGSGNAILHGHKTGIAHFHEHLCLGYPEGYEPGTTQIIAKRKDAYINASTGYDKISFQLDTPTRNWDVMADLFTAISCRLLITPDSVEKEKDIILTEDLEGVVKRPEMNLFRRAMPFAYQDDRFFNDQLGLREDVSSTTPENILAYRHQFFNAGQTTLVVEGGVPHNQVTKKLEEKFSLPKLDVHPAYTATMKMGDQRWENRWQGTLCSLFFPAPSSYKPRDIVSYNMFSHFLYANMQDKIRQRTGIYTFVYDNSFEKTNSQMNNSFLVYPEKVDVVLDTIGQTLCDLATKGCQEELNHYKAECQAHHKERKRYAFYGAGNIVFQLRMAGRFIPWKESLEAVLSVTNEDIIRYAQTMASGPHFFGAQGNLKGLPKRDEIRTLLRMSKRPVNQP